MYEKEDISAGKFAFTAKEAGMHQVCFSNYGTAIVLGLFAMVVAVWACAAFDLTLLLGICWWWVHFALMSQTNNCVC